MKRIIEFPKPVNLEEAFEASQPKPDNLFNIADWRPRVIAFEAPNLNTWPLSAA